jgi:acyl-CoA synthetase (AMP-forming)/AMP-acid ligase II
MIKVRGFPIAPADIEAIQFAVAGVTDCAVFGVPDETLGEAIVAAASIKQKGRSHRRRARA